MCNFLPKTQLKVGMTESMSQARNARPVGNRVLTGSPVHSAILQTRGTQGDHSLKPDSCSIAHRRVSGRSKQPAQNVHESAVSLYESAGPKTGPQ